MRWNCTAGGQDTVFPSLQGRCRYSPREAPPPVLPTLGTPTPKTPTTNTQMTHCDAMHCTARHKAYHGPEATSSGVAWVLLLSRREHQGETCHEKTPVQVIVSQRFDTFRDTFGDPHC